ncbi:DUF6578 domain-containing protein [Streptomyces sp. BK022]|uniref:DUF6578 domain-containing protein n=1 Tax=Streptomyces sp. BK022 TaxID=2512123 RepID=UPI00102A89B4|nr:DUF6578 domain-containing protein [Streptomyces sp. BK022]
MMLTVWVDDWQMQCCGEDFAVGDVVSWTLIEADPEDYADVVGEKRAEGIGFREEHHGGAGECAAASVEVLSIDEVHCRYEIPAGATDRLHVPVRDTTVLVPVGRADGWARPRPDVSFAGYLVTARRVTGLPEDAVT